MSVNEAKSKFEAAKEMVEESQKLLSDLTKRYDDLQESLPQLKNKCGIVEQNETIAYDSHVLGKISAKELEKVKTECQTVKNQYAESSKMLESLGRGIKKIESNLQRLNAEAELAKRQVWEAISKSYESKITDEVREYIAIITTVGSQIGRSRQYVLDCLFRNPTHDDVQEIQKNLREEYSID